MYCLAGYIRLFDARLLPVLKTWKGWLAAHIGVWAAVAAFFVIWEKYGYILGRIVPIDEKYFIYPNSVPMLALSVTLFMTFKKISLPNSRIINYLASTTFGIYLLHGGRSGPIWWNRVFHDPALEGTAAVFGDMLLALALILALGVLIESARRQIEKRIILPMLEKLPVFR